MKPPPPLLRVVCDAVPLCVVCDAEPVQSAASAAVVPYAPVRGVDAGVSGGLYADGAGRVVVNAAACRGDVDFGAAAARSSAGGAVVFQVMNPGPFGFVPRSLVDGAPVSSNCPQPDSVPS